MTIELFDLKSQYRNMQSEIDAVLQEVLSSGQYILGPKVHKLEQQVADYCGVKYGVGVASGTDAIFVSLVANNIGKGDEVITTPYTFFATAGAIARTGAIPVFVDIDPRTCNIDTGRIEERITGRTRAIIPVHIFGQMADMNDILHIAEKYNLTVIEDACQAIGSESLGRKAGSLGHAGCFSFFPSKNLGCYGDGGMVITGDEKMAAKIKSLRVHGSGQKFIHRTVGFNSRLDEIQAAVLLVKLKHLDVWLNKRIALAQFYDQLLANAVAIPYVSPGNRHTYQLYVIRTSQRNLIKKHLKANGVSCGIYYPVPLHLQVAFNTLGYKKGDLPESEKASDELLAIPLYPELSLTEAVRITNLVKQAIVGESAAGQLD